MSTAATPLPTAWEPLTPRGVARFASATLVRLLVVQSLVALLAAGSVVWFLERAWFPVIRHAIQKMPADGEISDGQLYWPADSPMQLGGNRALGLTVDLTHSGKLGREAQLQVEFGRHNFRIFSMPGYVVLDYAPDWNIGFNRTELEPWWGAWEPVIAIAAAAITFIGLMISWAVLATIYCAPVRLITFFENRDLNWPQSWRMSGAALMPAALFLSCGIICHGLGWIDLIQLCAVFGLHVIIGWMYLFVSPFFLPRHPAAPKMGTNPFAKAKGGEVPRTG